MRLSTFFANVSTSEQISRVGWSDSDSVACFDLDGLALPAKTLALADM